MSLWRQLRRGLRALTHRTTADQDVADEVQDYLEQATAAHLARGVSPDDARRLARLELGNTRGVVEDVRSSGWEHLVETAMADVQHAMRRLRAAPGFTAVIVLTLALGIGATTAILSAVNPILFQPLPYPRPDRLVAVLELGRDGRRGAGTFAMFRAFADRSRSFDAIATIKAWQPTLTGTDEPQRLEGQRVTAEYFRVIGVLPTVGRDFSTDDDRADGPNVVILSDRIWRQQFNADPAIVGRAIRLDDNAFQVIGVMPAAFDNAIAPDAGIWAPLQYDLSQGRAWGHHLQTIARLRPGLTFEQATQDLAANGASVLDEQHPLTYDPMTKFVASSLQSEMTRSARPALVAIMGAVALVLVIACANVTNLLLARGVQRQGEFAMRVALGASRGRLIRQMLTESLVLAAIGGTIGVVIAAAGVRALVALSPPGLPRANAIGVDPGMLAFAFVITVVVAAAFGALPALQAARGTIGRLQLASKRLAGDHRRARAALVISEVALALVLLVGSGLLLRSMTRLFAVPIGFEPSHLLTMQVRESGRRFDAPEARTDFFARALEAVEHVPGVVAAGLTSQLPLSGDLDQYGIRFDPSPLGPAETIAGFRYAVTPGYFHTMGVPLVSGRLFDDHDRVGATPVAIFSRSLATARSTGSVIGEHVNVGAPGPVPYTIVGVVGDVRQQSLAVSDAGAVYIPAPQWQPVDTLMSFVVRTRGEAAALAPSIRQAIWSVDKDQPVLRIATMDELLTRSAAERRFSLVVFETFAFVAVVLAAAGLYGLLSGRVAERTREMGVRAVLGASRGMIVGLVVRQGLALTAFGIAIGLAIAIAASRALVTMLFGVSRLDPPTYAGVVVLLIVVATAACALPAWRAARVDPATALRVE
jgi:predicted permease